MKKILIPTDFSEHADHALQVAAQLARRYSCELYLLHMIELPVEMNNPVGDNHTSDLPEAIGYMKLAKRRFNEIMTRKYMQEIKVFEIVELHRAFEGIMETSKKHNCDFIVMGSRGASGLREMFVGSNTEKVVRTAEVPVLVIKEPRPDFRVKNFAFATDLDHKNRKALQRVKEFARLLEAKLHLVYVNTASEFITSRDVDFHLERYLEGFDRSNIEFHIYNDDTIEKGILHFSSTHHIDLIGIATHGRKGLAHFFNGSISEDLVNHAHRPVITFKLES